MTRLPVFMTLVGVFMMVTADPLDGWLYAVGIVVAVVGVLWVFSEFVGSLQGRERVDRFAVWMGATNQDESEG